MKKTTQELLQLMQNESNYDAYLEQNRKVLESGTMRINRALEVMIAEKHLKRSEVIGLSGLEPHYAYQILSGRKIPTRDKVLALCFGMRLTVEETQTLLRTTGYAQLYAKDLHDNVIIFGLMHHWTVLDVNYPLADLGFPCLG